MKETVDFVELNKTLNNIKMLTDKMKNNLENIDSLITDNINNNTGILDGNIASEFLKKWDTLREEIPASIDSINKQELNLEVFINSMQKENE